MNKIENLNILIDKFPKARNIVLGKLIIILRLKFDQRSICKLAAQRNLTMGRYLDFTIIKKSNRKNWTHDKITEESKKPITLQ